MHTGLVDVQTKQLVLHELTAEETQRVLRRERAADEVWAPGYPTSEQVDYLEAYLVELRTTRPGTQWQSQMRRRVDGLVIGGAGVTGPPNAEGELVVGYEIDATAPDEDYGVEVVAALLHAAREMGGRRAITSTPLFDVVRQDAYLRNGFTMTRQDDASAYFEIEL
jgi:RimJ/RimL family protein N-acetyltransferase